MSSRVPSLFLSLALIVGIGSAPAATFVDWDPTLNTNSTNSGSAAGVNVTATYTTFRGSVSTSSFMNSGAFNPAAGSSREVISYSVANGITWSFSSAVTNLQLYTAFWRSAGQTGPSDNQYVFSTAPTIQSGFSGASISGSNLVMTGTGYYFGILNFAGPLTSLTLSIPVGGSGVTGLQDYTLAFDAVPPAVPDQGATLSLLGAAVGALGLAARRRRR
jgi:hypothetical protein